MRLAVDRNGDAGFEADGDFAGLAGRLGGAVGEHPDLVGRGVGGVFERAALVGDVPDVAVAAVDFGGGSGDGDVALAGVLDGILAGDDGPLAPGSDDGQVGGERLVSELEAHLVVALAGAAVGEGVAARGEGDLDLFHGEQRAGDGSAEQVLMLVDAAGADKFPKVLGDELLAQVLDMDVAGAGFAGLFLEAGELIAALADIAAHGDDFAAVVLLEPRNDDGGIQPAGVGECNFLRFVISRM